MRRILAVLFILVAVLVGGAVPAAQASTGTLPAGCTMAPGRFTVAQAPPQDMVVSDVAMTCPVGDTIFVTGYTLRYYVSTKTWVEEHTFRFHDSYSNTVPALTASVVCNVPGALMLAGIEYKIFRARTVIARVIHPGFNKVLCRRF